MSGVCFGNVADAGAFFITKCFWDATHFRFLADLTQLGIDFAKTGRHGPNTLFSAGGWTIFEVMPLTVQWSTRHS